MKPKNLPQGPKDEKLRRGARPVICYPVKTLPQPDMINIMEARKQMEKISETVVLPREASCIEIPKAHFFRISCNEGAQVGDLNLWASANLKEHFYAGKTRALHGTHLSTGDRLWSNLPYLRPLATISHDTLDWYGWDEDGGSVHDVIGTRCDPYTAKMLNNTDYHHCCHSNLTHALATFCELDFQMAEAFVHDVLNVFMCTGFTTDTHQYFMKASPVRPGDYLEFFAETNLIAGLSACPGGDCSSEHSSDQSECFPLTIEVFKTNSRALQNFPYLNKSQYIKRNQ